jgi:putative sterol carrier protein
MTSSIDQFFDDLEHRGHEPLLRRVDATLRFDIADGERTDHRLIRVDHGDIRVAVGNEPADCVISAERSVCDDVVSGRTSALAALLRGAAAVEGDMEVMVLAQRLFTGSQTVPSGRSAVAADGRSS